MAILFNNITKCGLCNKVINVEDEIIAFPAFILDKCDPLFKFTDSVYHKSCLLDNYLGEAASQRLAFFLNNTGPSKRKCIVCKSEIINPDDYLLIDYLTSDKRHFLFKYNYTHIHKSHLNKWKDREKVINNLIKLKDVQCGNEAYISRLIKNIRNLYD
jgi:hypothetical protein